MLEEPTGVLLQFSLLNSPAVGSAAQRRYNQSPFQAFFFANEITVPNTTLGFFLSPSRPEGREADSNQRRKLAKTPPKAVKSAGGGGEGDSGEGGCGEEGCD